MAIICFSLKYLPANAFGICTHKHSHHPFLPSKDTEYLYKSNLERMFDDGIASETDDMQQLDPSDMIPPTPRTIRSCATNKQESASHLQHPINHMHSRVSVKSQLTRVAAAQPSHVTTTSAGTPQQPQAARKHNSQYNVRQHSLTCASQKSQAIYEPNSQLSIKKYLAANSLYSPQQLQSFRHNCYSLQARKQNSLQQPASTRSTVKQLLQKSHPERQSQNYSMPKELLHHYQTSQRSTPGYQQTATPFQRRHEYFT